MKKILLSCLVFLSIQLVAQEKSSEVKALDVYNDTLKVIIKQMRSSKTDDEKHKYNAQLLATFNHVLKMTGSFSYPFDSITSVGILNSPDKMLRIFTWNIPLDNGTHEYYGFIYCKQIQVKKEGWFKKTSTETYKVFPLTDVSKNISNAENYISDNNKWYGMLYYAIIPKKAKNKNTFYTLLAWDGNDKFSSKKIIDVLTFDNKGNPVFGGSVFNTLKGVKKRVVFEFEATCTMSLKYNKNKDSIIFDHLVPVEPQLEGQFQYYCTDFTYDGFGFKNGKWNYGEYIHATNEKSVKDNYYRDPANNKEEGTKNSEITKPKAKEQGQ